MYNVAKVIDLIFLYDSKLSRAIGIIPINNSLVCFTIFLKYEKNKRSFRANEMITQKCKNRFMIQYCLVVITEST